MTKYYYNRDGIPTTEQQMLQQHLNYSHSDSNRVGSGIGLAGNSGLGSGNNGGYNPYMGPQGGLGYPMHSQGESEDWFLLLFASVQQQRVPMPQLQARSQSGGTPSGMTDYSNIPQMQRSITTPYGGISF